MNDSAQAALVPLMMGIPDNSLIKVSARPDGTPAYHFLGNSRIGTNLAPAIKHKLLRVFFGPDFPIRVPPALRSTPMINAVADPDISSIALRMLREHLAGSGVACFNHPAAVQGTTRDGIAAKLAGIPGVQMPRTLRVRLQEPAELVRFAAEHALRWPLIVRIAGSHRGAATALSEAPARANDALRGLQWGGHDLYLTEYVDCRDGDGHYRKLRIAMVGGEIFMRHLVIADGWLVHVHDRKLGHLDEEIASLRDFRTGLLPDLRDRLRAIADAIGMDYFGIDCNPRPDGRLLVFEVNAMMDILTNTMAQPNCWDEPIALIHDALVALLSDPARWLHPQRAAASA